MSMSPDQHEVASTDAERVVADAWHRVLDLVDRLIAQPIDAATYNELRAYLDDDADEAIAAYEQVTADGVAALLERVDQLSEAPPTLAVIDGGDGSGKAAS
jgi:GrpB-like predicted nucleotidyltransferase (UPF0157 family)